jgi:hypothetical protein
MFAAVRLETAPRVLDDACLVAIEPVQHLLRHGQVNIATFDQIFDLADDGLFAIILRKAQPDAGIDQKPDCHTAPLSVRDGRMLLEVWVHACFGSGMARQGRKAGYGGPTGGTEVGAGSVCRVGVVRGPKSAKPARWRAFACGVCRIRAEIAHIVPKFGKNACIKESVKSQKALLGFGCGGRI